MAEPEKPEKDDHANRSNVKSKYERRIYSTAFKSMIVQEALSMPPNNRFKPLARLYKDYNLQSGQIRKWVKRFVKQAETKNGDMHMHSERLVPHCDEDKAPRNKSKNIDHPESNEREATESTPLIESSRLLQTSQATSQFPLEEKDVFLIQNCNRRRYIARIDGNFVPIVNCVHAQVVRVHRGSEDDFWQHNRKILEKVMHIHQTTSQSRKDKPVDEVVEQGEKI